MNPKISIITTNYNREKFLPQCIESVLNQSEENFEYIIWDDGSVDSSLKIINNYAKQDKRIKAFFRSWQGACISMDSAIEYAKGDYVGWVDSDDYLHPHCLHMCKFILDCTERIGLTYTNHETITEDGRSLGLGYRCIIPYFKDALLLTYMTHHFRLFRRKLYQDIGGLDLNLRYAFDYDLCLKLSEITEVYHIERVLYYYRQHSTSITQSKEQEQIYYAHQARKNAMIRRGYEA